MWPHSDRANQKDQYDDDFAQKVLGEIRGSLGRDGSCAELTRPISWEEVHIAVRRLPNGKAPGPDGISNELLVIAGLGFEMALAQIFNEIWTTLLWPTPWRLATLIPLYKNAGNVLDLNNYRMLALMSTIP